MTTIQATARRIDMKSWLERIPLRPAEGWITLIATGAMAFLIAASLREANWIPPSVGDTTFLGWVAIAGVAVGFIGAKVGWGRWRTHLVGAALAGLILPLIMGDLILGPAAGALDPAGLAARMDAASRVAHAVWQDLVVEGRPNTVQIAHYYLVFGMIVWAAGQLAGFTVFGHRRTLDAVIVLGIALLANLEITRRDLLQFFIAFSLAALVLLVRTHVFEEQVTWARRRIGDPASVRQLYLRGGAIFVAAAVASSALLTVAASSAPLQGVFSDLPQRLQDVTDWLQRFQPPGGEFRGPGTVGFRDEAITSGFWNPSSGVAFRAQVPTADDATLKWRAGTYAVYTNYGWKQGPVTSVPADAHATLLQGLADQAPTKASREIRVRVIPDGFRDPTILSPASVQWVDRPTNALVVGTGGYFAQAVLRDSGSAYQVDALVPDYAKGITEAELETAGTAYPAEIRTIYTQLEPNAMGPTSIALLKTIQGLVDSPDGAPKGNAYDLAKGIQAYLRDPANFTYQPDVRNLLQQCDGVSTVECFAKVRKGYCEYYASEMAVMLRYAGIPARIAYGFLPSTPEADGTEVVPGSSQHWWVEVYFPNVGWVEFDPTGGDVGRPPKIAQGSIAPATPTPSHDLPTFAPRPSGGIGGPTGQTTGGSGSSAAPFIAIGLILLVGVGALAFAALRRLPRRAMHPDQAWGSLGRLAARLGMGPQPSQTVYEYAGVLGDAVPGARPELTTIARAKVEVAYGRRDMGGDTLRRIGEAYGRLRLALIGVALRRGFRRQPRR